MAERGKVTEFFSIPDFQQQLKVVKEGLQQFIDTANNAKPISIGLQGAEKTKDVVKGITDLSLATKEHEKNINNVATAQAKLNASNSAAAKQLQELKVAQQQQNQATKDEIALNQAAEGSITQKRVQLKQLQAQYDALSASQRNSSEGQGLLKSIQATDKELKNLEASTGRHQRKVGDYVGAISILEKSLQEVKTKMDQFTKSGQSNGAEMDKLREEASLLEALVGQQSKGFASMTMEIRNSERALFSMREAGLQDTEGFQQLQVQVANSKRELNEFNRSQKILTSEAPALTALTVAAKGLAGIYAVGAGASALFANGNEKVEKELNKLVAVMTLLQGLEEANRLIKERGAIVLALQTGATKVAVVWQKLYTFAVGESTGALRVFRIALASTGIGALLLLLPLFVKGMEAITQSNKDAAESQKLLNEQLEIEAGFVEDSVEAISKAYQKRTAEMERDGNKQSEIRDKNIEALELELEAAKKYYDETDASLQKLSRRKAISADAEAENIENFKKAQDVQSAAGKKYYDLVDKLELARIDNQKKHFDETRQDQKNYLEILKNNTDKQIEFQKDIADAEGFSLSARVAARRKASELQKSNIRDEADFELSERGITDSKIAAIVNNRNNAIKKEEESLAHDLVQIYAKTRAAEQESLRADVALAGDMKSSFEINMERIDKASEKHINNVQEDRDSVIASIEREKNAKLSATKDDAERQAIEEKYNRKRVAVELEANKAILLDAIKVAEAKLALISDPNQRAGLAAQIADAKKQLEELNVEGGKNAFTDKFADANKHLTDFAEGLKRAATTATQAFKAIGDIVGASIDRQKNALQDQIDLIDLKKEKDIEAENASVDSAQKKADKIAVIDARAASQKEALERRKRQLDEQRARFEKAQSIAQIIADTAVAVVEALGSKPFTPANIALAVAVGVIGAAELAAAIAAPIPKFKGGKNVGDGYEGLGYVGDGGKRELHITPDGAYITPNVPTLAWIGKKDVILPDADSVMKSLQYSAFRNIDVRRSMNESSYARVMTRAIENKLDTVNNTIKNKKELHIKGSHTGAMMLYKEAERWTKYIKDQTDW